jgi:hypothetical protein
MKMKDLCSRARAAMNLVLLLVVFQLWVLLPGDSSRTQVELDLSNIYDSLGTNPDDNGLTQHFRDFRESYKQLHPENDLEDIPLALVLNLEDKDPRLQKLPPPAPPPAPASAPKVETEKERVRRRDDAILAPDTYTENQLPFVDPYAEMLPKLPSFDLRELKQWIREAELPPNATKIGVATSFGHTGTWQQKSGTIRTPEGVTYKKKLVITLRNVGHHDLMIGPKASSVPGEIGAQRLDQLVWELEPRQGWDSDGWKWQEAESAEVYVTQGVAFRTWVPLHENATEHEVERLKGKLGILRIPLRVKIGDFQIQA